MKALAVSVVCLLALLGGGCANRSWNDLANTNGFSGPVELYEDRGGKQLVLTVSYGSCRIHVLTHRPWYDSYAVTYLPADVNLQKVDNATATKLNQLPKEYNLGVCAAINR